MWLPTSEGCHQGTANNWVALPLSGVVTILKATVPICRHITLPLAHWTGVKKTMYFVPAGD